MLLLFWPVFLAAAATTTAADLPNQGCVRLLRDVSLGREASIMSVISGLIAIAVNKKYRELLHYVDTVHNINIYMYLLYGSILC